MTQGRTADPRPIVVPHSPRPARRTPRCPRPGARTVEQVTGAQSLVRSLEEAGVRGRLRHPRRRDPAGLRPAADSTRVRHVLVRHEQGAGHAANGYAQATGKVGVCMATSGPGATNLVTPIADAYMDSVPIVAITGQVGRAADRHRRLPGGRHLRHHACRSPSTTSWSPTRPRSRGRSRRRSTSPSTGRPGPVLVDMPEGRAAGADHLRLAAGACTCPATGRRPGRTASRSARRRKLIAARPAAGALRRRRRAQGRGRRGAARARRADRHPGGHHADGPRRLPRLPPPAPRHAGHARHRRRGRRACRSADLLIALGARFDDRVTGQLATFAPHAKIIHADIDPAEIGKNRARRRADRRRRPRGHRRADRRACRRAGRRRGRRPRPRGGPQLDGLRHDLSRSATTGRPTARCPRST